MPCGIRARRTGGKIIFIFLLVKFDSQILYHWSEQFCVGLCHHILFWEKETVVTNTCMPKIKKFFSIAIYKLQLWNRITVVQKEITSFPFCFVGYWTTEEGCCGLPLTTWMSIDFCRTKHNWRRKQECLKCSNFNFSALWSSVSSLLLEMGFITSWNIINPLIPL